MNSDYLPRIQIVGTHSGSGKTTVTCAILHALCKRGLKAASFKCGPDYIDPMFHTKILGLRSRNLDVFMSGEEGVRFLFARNAKGADISVIEGVMGMYDGASFNSGYASSNHVAALTQTPQILVVDAAGMGRSLLSVVHGFASFEQNRLAGIILNNCSDKLYGLYKSLIEDACDLRVYGHLPRIKEAVISSRHLGLITADEIADIDAKLAVLGEAAAQHIDISGIIELSRTAPGLGCKNLWAGLEKTAGVRIGVAKDNAFSFLYQDNIDLLEELGAKIVYFSPIGDAVLPEVDGLILSGGYPEVHARALEQNEGMRQSIRKAVLSGMPTIAECGGFMYLLDTITCADSQSYKMAGAISGYAFMTQKLDRFGYVTLTAKHAGLLCRQGECIMGHEFHYSDSSNNGDGFVARKKDRQWDCIHTSSTLFAGYPHIHFAADPIKASRFINACMKHKGDRK